MTDTNATPGPPDAGESDAPRSCRDLILDHLLDTVEAGAQTRQQILDAMPGVDPNAIDQALHRMTESGDVVRPARGTYALAPPKPPPPPALAADGRPVEDWLKDLWGWYADPATWDVAKLGPPPRDPKRRVPADVMAEFHRQLAERVVAAEQAQAEKAAQSAEKAAAAPPKAVAAANDVELLKQLLDATHGNFIDGPGIRDISPIVAVLKTIPLERVLSTVRGKHDPRVFPKNPPLRSWRDQALLRAIAERFCKNVLIPRMVEVWGNAAPGQR
jgi:hypothetical protein